jgi:shikimate kinase
MPLVAEIVGPAGSGKSTLAGALKARDGGVRAGLSVWGLPAPLLLSTALLSLPQLLGMWRRRGAFGWEEAGLVVRLNALGRLLNRESAGRGRFLLLDEGTVFALAKLRVFGRAGLFGEEQLARMAGRWARTLDAVVWLDAPDEVLARRIRGREKPHRMKGLSDEEISAFLARYREAYERVLAELCARRRLKVIRVSTDTGTPEQIAEAVLSGIVRAEG